MFVSQIQGMTKFVEEDLFAQIMHNLSLEEGMQLVVHMRLSQCSKGNEEGQRGQ